MKPYSIRALSLLICALMLLSPIAAQEHFERFTLRLVTRTGDTVAGHVISYLGSPTINNQGLIVFTARFNDIPTPDCPGVTATALCTSAILTPTGLIAKTGDMIGGETITWISDPVALNDSGTVAFAAGTTKLDARSGHGQHAIFTQHQLIAKPRDIIDGCTISEIGYSDTAQLDPRPAIDQAGTVFFSAKFFSPCRGRSIGSNLFTKDHIVPVAEKPVGFFAVSGTGTIGALAARGIYDRSRALVRYGTRIDGQRVDGIRPPAINNKGEVVFAGQFACSSSGGCTDYLATRLRLIARQGETLGGMRVSEFRTPVIDNRDVIAVRALVAPGNADFLLFSTRLGVIAKPGDMIEGRILKTVGRPVLASYAGLNDEGKVVFLGEFTDGSQAIILATPDARH